MDACFQCVRPFFVQRAVQSCDSVGECTFVVRMTVLLHFWFRSLDLVLVVFLHHESDANHVFQRVSSNPPSSFFWIAAGHHKAICAGILLSHTSCSNRLRSPSTVIREWESSIQNHPQRWQRAADESTDKRAMR